MSNPIAKPDAQILAEAQDNLDKAAECFNNVPPSDENYDTYCEEMQGALEAYDEAIRRTI